MEPITVAAVVAALAAFAVAGRFRRGALGALMDYAAARPDSPVLRAFVAQPERFIRAARKAVDSRSDGEDAVQVALIEATEAERRGVVIENPDQFLLTVVARRARDMLDRRQVERRLFAPLPEAGGRKRDDPTGVVRPPSDRDRREFINPGEAPDARLHRRALGLRLRRVLATFPSRAHRRAIAFSVAQPDLTQTEIARRTGLSNATVTRVLVAFRARMAGQE